MADVDPTLRVSNLTVAYRNGNGWLEAVRDVSFDVQPGQACGLIGESGSGKTTVALAIMRYLPREGSVRGGSIALDGRDLLALRPGQMSAIWGSRLALVPQDPLAALNPSLRLGQQLGEVLQHHQGLRRQDADRRVRELFASVRLADPDRVARAYPHQVSGGMLQRVMIAMALSTEPRLLILDEPTSSLDVTTQATVLDLIRDLIREHRTSVLHISHNLGVLAQSSDRVEVLYAGELIEEGDTLDIYGQPLHPYTRGLLDSVPRLGVSKGRVRVRAIQGRIPGPGERPEGCIFRPRCPLAIEVCRIHPPLYDCGDGRRSRCHRWAEIQAHTVSARQPAPALPEESAREVVGQETVLGVQDLEVTFREPGAGLRALLGRPAAVRAVDGVGLRVRRGRTVGLVGESGSGKTSLARAITGLVERSGGTVTLHDHPLPRGLRGRDRETRRLLQMVFQNPEEALNPFHTVGEALRRPLMRLRGQSSQEAEEGARALLAQVQLDPEYAGRLPAELSGGEKQRVAIARAFATDPDLVLADEPVSSLDVSVQASILELLAMLQGERGVSTVFISHDLAVVGYLADDILVLYRGKVMEESPAEALFDPPYHPYTEALLASVPLIDPEGVQRPVRLEGEVPGPAEVLTGCPFHTRCPRFLGPICVRETPPWRHDPETGARIFCHIPLETLNEVQERPFAFRGAGWEG